MCVFICCPDTMRKSPTNYLLSLAIACGGRLNPRVDLQLRLLCFTVAESVMVGAWHAAAIACQFERQRMSAYLGPEARMQDL